MKLLTNKSRLLLSTLVIISFFIPAYNGISAFHFTFLALSAPDTQADINLIDVLILITPLILCPFIALVIFIRAYMKVPIRKTVTGLPFLLLVFFFVLLSFSNKTSDIHIPLSRFFYDMQVGFYLTFIASLILVFTNNASRYRRRRKTKPATTAIATIDPIEV